MNKRSLPSKTGGFAVERSESDERGRIGYDPGARQFGDLLREYRREVGLSQEELAERAGVSDRGIRSLELGSRRPQKGTLQRLIAALALEPQNARLLERAARSGGRSALRVLRPDFGDQATGLGQSLPAAGLLSGSGEVARLVGRQEELAILEEHLRGHGAPVLFLAGEPGIGKTRLLQEAAHVAASQGFTVLAGGCQRGSGQEPYAPLVDALGGYLCALTRVQQHAALHEARWLAALLPELAAPVELPRSLPPGRERRLIFDAAGRFLRTVAGPAGTLLLLDDLQWAGQDALDLLAALARSAAGFPLRIVAAYRATEVEPAHPLAVALADLAHAQLVRQVSLQPLAAEKAERLLASLVDEPDSSVPELAHAIVERTGGVPYFLISCAQALRLGMLDPRTPGEVPWDITQGIQQRLAAQPRLTQEILQTASVIGRVVPYTLLVETGGGSEDEVAAAVDAACQGRLLTEEGQAIYRFVHDVIREVIEQGIGAARRRVLHRRIGEALAALPEHDRRKRAAELAWHFREANVPGRALPYTIEAGDAAEAVFAHAEAEELYRTALRLVQEIDDGPAEAGTLVRLGKVLTTLARYDEAVAALDKATALFGGLGDHEAEQEVVALTADVLGTKGAAAEGIARVRAALHQAADAEPGRGTGLLYQTLTGLLGFVGRYRDALETVDRLAEIGAATADAQLMASAALLRAGTISNLGDREVALHIYEDALPLAERSGDMTLVGHALSNLAQAAFWVGNLARYLTLQRRLLDLAEKEGDPEKVAASLVHVSLALHEMGDWKEAQICAERAQGIVDEIGRPAIAADVYAMLLTIAGRMGNWEEVPRYAAIGLAIADASGALFPGAWLREVWAEAVVLQGRPEEVVATLPEYVERCRAEGVGFERLVLWPLAWAELELGHLDRAEELSQRVMELAYRDHDRMYMTEAAPVRIAVLCRRRQWTEAEQIGTETLALADEIPRPYLQGRIRYELGLLHREMRQDKQARGELEEALGFFECLGAQAFVERTGKILKEMEP